MGGWDSSSQMMLQSHLHATERITLHHSIISLPFSASPSQIPLPTHQAEGLRWSQRSPDWAVLEQNCSTVQFVPAFALNTTLQQGAEMGSTPSRSAARPGTRCDCERWTRTGSQHRGVPRATAPPGFLGNAPVLGAHSGVEAREVSRQRQGKLALNSVCHSWICSAQGEKHLMLTEKVRSHLRTLTLCSEQNNRLGSFITLWLHWWVKNQALIFSWLKTNCIRYWKSFQNLHLLPQIQIRFCLWVTSHEFFMICYTWENFSISPHTQSLQHFWIFRSLSLLMLLHKHLLIWRAAEYKTKKNKNERKKKKSSCSWHWGQQEGWAEEAIFTLGKAITLPAHAAAVVFLL